MADVAPEVLSHEGPSRTRLVVTVLLVLGLALAAFWYVDDRRSDRERTALANCLAATTVSVAEAEQGLGVLYDYISPVVDPPRSDDAATMYVLLSDRAPELRPPVSHALSACREVELWRHHTRFRDARDAAVTLLTAELARLDDIAADGSAYVGGGREIERLQHQVERAYADLNRRGTAGEPR